MPLFPDPGDIFLPVDPRINPEFYDDPHFKGNPNPGMNDLIDYPYPGDYDPEKDFFKEKYGDQYSDEGHGRRYKVYDIQGRGPLDPGTDLPVGPYIVTDLETGKSMIVNVTGDAYIDEDGNIKGNSGSLVYGIFFDDRKVVILNEWDPFVQKVRQSGKSWLETSPLLDLLGVVSMITPIGLPLKVALLMNKIRSILS